jgi:DNA-binding response OmpR family regulator
LRENVGTPVRRTVAIFNGSEDTVDLLRCLLGNCGYVTIAGRADDVKSGVLDFVAFLATHKPDAIIWDITPPYERNWNFFKLLRSASPVSCRAVVLTTTHKQHLDELAREDTGALEIVGKPYDLQAIVDAVVRTIERLPGETRHLQAVT